MHPGYKLNTVYTACLLAMQEDNYSCKQIKQGGMVSQLVKEN